jgi:hypothetical protein
MRQSYDRRGKPIILANLSQYHPDYGMTPAQHEAAKAERLAGDRPFQDKAVLRQRRRGLAGRLGL